MQARDAAIKARTDAEFRQFSNALEQYRTKYGEYPGDVSRSIPPGIEEFLSSGDWPDAPWPGSIYDWEAWEIGGEDIYQLSVRFCPQGGSLEDCSFPNQDWAEDFGINSAYFYCFSGTCRSHSNESASYPGYCANCDCKETAECN